MTAKEKANELIEMHKPLSLSNAVGYSITYCNAVLKDNPTLTDAKKEFWESVRNELTTNMKP